MMRSSMAFGLALLVALSGAGADAQAPPPTDNLAGIDNLAGNDALLRENGSAAVLTGPVGIYHIFVSEDIAGWSEGEIEQVLNDVEEALLFLDYQAQLHGYELVFQQEAVQVVYEAGVPSDLTADPQWTERILQATGAMNGNDLAADLGDRWGVEHVLIALHVNKPGLSYALAYLPGADPNYMAERVILFTEYPDGRPTAPATYAHEVLHLFGACDLYFPTDTDDSRRQLAERLFPDDIMLRVDYDLDNLTVNDFTAYRVGWLEGLREAYQTFEN